jgi:hypothetical protein
VRRLPWSIGLALVVAGSGCSRRPDSQPAPDAAAAAPAPPATGAPQTPAGGTSGMGSMGGMHSHIPKYGGTVLMNGDMHFEVLLHRNGQYRIYFSDVNQNDLPASMASDVSITVMRKAGPPEKVTLRIDDSGESWIGQGTPVPDPDATARIAYTFRGMKPYWIDLPFSVQDPRPPASK